jgi:hypothetical protein
MSFDFDIEHDNNGARMGKIKISNNIIKTPKMGLNHIERQYLRKGEGVIRTSKTQDFNLYEIVSDLQVDKNTRTDKIAFQKLIESIKRKSRKNVPTITQFRLNTKSFSQRILRFLINAQIEADCSEIITIPDPILRTFDQTWRNYLDDAVIQTRNHFGTGKLVNLMPILPLRQGKRVLLQKVNYLLSKNIETIGFRMVGSGKKYLNEIIENINSQENDIWIHLTDVSKSWNGISEPHINTLYGADTFIKRKAHRNTAIFLSLRQTSVASRGLMPTPVGITIPTIRTQTTIHPIVENKNIFESKYLGYINPNDIIADFGPRLICHCPVCRNAISVDKLKRQLIASYGRGILEVHNYFNANQEFEKIRTSIDNDNVQNYFIQKRFIQNNLNIIQVRFPRMV